MLINVMLMKRNRYAKSLLFKSATMLSVVSSILYFDCRRYPKVKIAMNSILYNGCLTVLQRAWFQNK